MLTRLLAHKSAPSVLLVFAALLAIAMKNSFFHEFYEALKNTPVVFQIGNFIIDKPLLLWINDGLMAIFFFLVGLETKREFIGGALSKPGQIALPFFAAIGGLVCPALFYVYVNAGDPALLKGWAIPAATDIAFALGILMLLGDRIPHALKVVLVAIAIIDDIAAIIIIALFYTAETSMLSLGLASVGLGIVYYMGKYGGVRHVAPYVLMGLLVWACVLKSGVHATLAGVALGLLVPYGSEGRGHPSPSKVMEKSLHPWVVFGVLPVFAFANAGLDLSGFSYDSLLDTLVIGIALGLFFGKQIGVMAATLLGRLIGVCCLPKGVSWFQYYGMAIVTGVGFTMSLFIGTLAFVHVEHATAVRLGVLLGSFLSAVVGCLVLLAATKKKH